MSSDYLSEILEKLKYLSGYVFQKSSKKISLYEIFKVANVNTLKVINVKGPLNEIDDWFYGTVISKYPLKNENSEGPFEYNFFFKEKENTNISLMLSENKDIAKSLLDLVQKVDKNFFPVRINTEKIIKFILVNDNDIEPAYSDIFSEYIITYLHSKMKGMQQKLNSTSLYGRDVIRSILYVDYSHHFDPVSCGIGTEDNSFSGYSEIVRISNDGYVSFNCVGREVFNNIRNIIVFIKYSNCFMFI